MAVNTTEAINENSIGIDRMSALEIARTINTEDKKVAEAVETQLEPIARAIDGITERIQRGGRLIYIGAGTSGRLGVIDATECPPTYGVSPELIQGVIAGGRDAMFRSSEGMEDSAEAAVEDLKKVGFSSGDVCFAISASGGAAYVISAVEYARSLGALTVGLSCNEGSKLSQHAEIAITPVVGPEVISGSTRMKAGTSQKLVLNMISTGVMIRTGHVKGNLMSCVRPTNIKLRDRAARIICAQTGAEYEAALEALDRAENNVEEAVKLLQK